MSILADGGGIESYTLTLILLGCGVLFAVLTLIYVIRAALSRGGGEIGGWEFRGAPGRIFAVARTTVREGLRARIALGFVVIILLWVPAIWFLAEGDGTTKGKVQMFMTYALGFSAFALGLLTILFSCRSLANEIASRQIYGIVSKPVPRWQLVMGKFTGVMVLNVLLMAYAGVGTWFGVKGLVSSFKRDLTLELQSHSGLTPEQAARAVASLDNVKGAGREGIESPIIEAMSNATGMTRQATVDALLLLPEGRRADLRRFDDLRRQVLIARAKVKPHIDHEAVRKTVDAKFKQRKDQGVLPQTMSEGEAWRQIEAEELAKINLAEAGGPPKAFEFFGPPPAANEDRIMSLRFKLETTSGLVDYTDPFTGERLSDDEFFCVFIVGAPQSRTNFAIMEEKQPIRTYQEWEIPSNCVDKDGRTGVVFYNRDPRAIDVTFNLAEENLLILYRVGSFELNLFHACIALLIPLTCLAAFGTCASTFLSFPVGALTVTWLFLLASSMGFVAESMAVTEDYIDPTAPPTLELELRRLSVDSIGWLLSMGDISPLADLMEGRSIGWDRIGSNVLRFGVLKSGAALLIAVLVFRRRELAAVIV